jgi:hypothetical protein
LEKGAGEIVLRKLRDGVLDRFRGQIRIEAVKGSAQVAGQDDFARVGAAQGSGEAEGFLVPGVDALPAEFLFQVPGESGLHQTVFAVDARDHPSL